MIVAGKIIFSLLVLGQSVPGNLEYGAAIVPVVDYDKKLVYYEKWIDSTYIGVISVESLEEYLASVERELSFERFRTDLRDKSKQREEEGQFGGIIPSIQIPMGREKTDISVSGSDRITLGSQLSNYPNRQDEELSERTNLLSGIILEQNLNVSVKGTIARKTKVEIDHSSGSTGLGDENNVRLSYTGDDDEIVKKIEAGDVALNLPSHQSIPAHEGLFGINAQTKFGPVDVYAVASREQTKAGELAYTGKSQAVRSEKYDRDYIRNRYFYAFHPSLRNQVRINNWDQQGNKFLLYIDDGTGDVPDGKQKYYGKAMLYPNLDSSQSSEIVTRQNFYLLKRGDGPDADYSLEKYDDSTWVIELRKSLGSNSVLGLICSTSTGFNHGAIHISKDTIYGIDTLQLLLVWGDNPAPETDTSWQNMRRNHYSLPGKPKTNKIKLRIAKQNLGIYVYKGENEQSSYASLMGLTEKGSVTYTLSPRELQMGQLIFDDTYPFLNPAVVDSSDDEEVTKVTQVYFDDETGADKGGLFRIDVEFESDVSSYNLGAFVKKNSVEVYVNGRKLSESEYDVDYTLGIVKLKNPVASTDEVKINYEQEELFALDRKSLLGLRAESEIVEGVKVGSSLLFRKVGYSGEGRPTLGLEPFHRTVAEIDLSAERELDFLTRMVDLIPLVSTETQSRANVTAYSAVSIPNPNTHKSNSVWIEDFEGTKEARPAPLSHYKNWYITSLPLNEEGMPITDTSFSTFSRTYPVWRESEKRYLIEQDIYGDTNIQDTSTVTPFHISWTPEADSVWSGIIGSAYGRIPMNITQAENLEIVMNTGGYDGIMHFEFGSEMNEDQLRFNKDGELQGISTFQEEGINDDDKDYSREKDVGLDTLAGADTDNISGDDGNDDFQPDSDKDNYNPNGTENNEQLDSEDLMQDLFNTTENDYYSFTFDPSDVDFVREYVDSLANGWIRISIPLQISTVPDEELDSLRDDDDNITAAMPQSTEHFFRKQGSPRDANISMFRLWFESVREDEEMNVLIHSWEFVGNKWQDPAVFTTDTTVAVDSTEKVYIDLIGTKQSSGDYTPPFDPGVSQGLPVHDHSLQMRYENIEPSHGARVRRWNYQDDDYRGYRRVKIYVHNDEENNPLFYLRMGINTRSYYEIRFPITAGEVPPQATDDRWREFSVDLDSLVNLKYENYYFLRYVDTFEQGVWLGDSLFASGVPSFDKIKYLELGIINQSEFPMTGEVWFNDIRLVEPYQNVGSELSVTGKINFADLATINGRYNLSDGKFTNLGDIPRPRTAGPTLSYGANASLNVEKFGLDRLGFKAPVQANYTHSQSEPYYSGEVPDYVIPDTAEFRDSVFNYSDAGNVFFNISHPKSKSKWLNYTLDGIKASGNYSVSRQHSNAGLHQDTSFTQDYDVSYNVNPDLSFKLFDKEKISYFPSSIRLSAGFVKKENYSLYRDRLRTPQDSVQSFDTTYTPNTSLNWTGSTNFSPIKYLISSANYSEIRSRDTVWRLPQFFSGEGSEFYNRTLGLSAGLRSVNFKAFGRPSLDVIGSFTEDKTYDSYENLRSSLGVDSFLADTLNVRNLGNSGSIKAGWSGFNLGNILSGAKSKAEEKLRDARTQAILEQNQTRDSLDLEPPEGDTGLVDSLSVDTLMIDSLPVDILPFDSIFGDSVFIDSVQADTFLSDDEPPGPTSPEITLYETRVERLKGLEKIGKVLMPLSVNASWTRSSHYPWYVGDFSWKDDWRYVTGMADSLFVDHRVDSNDTEYTSFGNPGSSGSFIQNYSANSGLTISGVIIKGNVSYNDTKNYNSTGTHKYNSSLTLPSITVTYSRFGDLFEKVANSSQISANVSRVISESGDVVPDTVVWFPETDSMTIDTIGVNRNPTNTTTQLNFNPLLSWNTTWKGRVTSNVSINYSVSQTVDYYGAVDSTDADTSTSITQGITANMGYTFNKPSGFRLSFLKHLKFKNDLGLNGTFTYNQTIQTYSNNKDNSTPDPNDLEKQISTTMSGKLGATYSFSEQFDAGLNLTVTKYTFDEKNDPSNHTDTRMEGFVTIKF